MTAKAKGKPRGRLGGRKKGTPNKLTAEISIACRDLTPKALATLLRIANNRTDLNAAVRAAVEILNRGWGMPTQSHVIAAHMKTTGEVSHHHTHELKPLNPAFQQLSPRELTATYREALDAPADGAGREQEGASH